MKKKPGFRLNNVCGVNVLIAEGKENIDFSNIVSMNDTAKFLWESIGEEEFTAEELAKRLVDNYEIDANTPLPYSQALADVESTVKAWKEARIIED